MSREKSRKYPRIAANIRVEWTLGDQTFRGRASTLGGGGIFIQTKDTAEIGSELLLRFRPAKQPPHIETKARVCYSSPGQSMAVEFINISTEQRELLLRLIHRKKTIDRRRVPRAPLATQIHCDEFSTIGFSRDVGTGGMLVETRETLPIGSRVNLRFNLEDGGPVVLAVGEVTYSFATVGMGVQFIDLATVDRERIAKYVAKFQSPAESELPIKATS